jgi:hypothetical protein
MRDEDEDEDEERAISPGAMRDTLYMTSSDAES